MSVARIELYHVRVLLVMAGLLWTVTRRVILAVKEAGSWSKMARYQTLAVEQDADSAHVFKVTLNRPDKSNAMNRAFWR